MAVQLVSYEMRMAFLTKNKNGKYTFNDRRYLSNSTRNGVFFAHTEQVYQSLGFIQNQGVIQKLRRLYNRSSLEKNELNILRGMLSAIEKRLNLQKE